jgi:hypothetical protein
VVDGPVAAGPIHDWTEEPLPDWTTGEWAAGRWTPYDASHLDDASLPQRIAGATSSDVFLPPPAAMSDPWPEAGTPIARRGAGSVMSASRATATRPPVPRRSHRPAGRTRIVGLVIVLVVGAAAAGVVIGTDSIGHRGQTRTPSTEASGTAALAGAPTGSAAPSNGTSARVASPGAIPGRPIGATSGSGRTTGAPTQTAAPGTTTTPSSGGSGASPSPSKRRLPPPPPPSPDFTHCTASPSNVAVTIALSNRSIGIFDADVTVVNVGTDPIGSWALQMFDMTGAVTFQSAGTFDHGTRTFNGLGSIDAGGTDEFQFKVIGARGLPSGCAVVES